LTTKGGGGIGRGRNELGQQLVCGEKPQGRALEGGALERRVAALGGYARDGTDENRYKRDIEKEIDLRKGYNLSIQSD